ncbi:unnamed protein product, partial [marine sediment metagenome]
LIIRAYDTGDRPILQIGTNAVLLADHPYVTLEDLDCRSTTGDAISVTGTSDHFIINNCVTDGSTGDGIGVEGTITEGTIQRCTTTDAVHGIYLSGVSGVTVEECETYSNGNVSQNAGIILDGCSTCIVKNNTTHDNIGAGIILFGGSDGNEVYDNLSYENTREGLAFGSSGGADTNKVYNNTFHNNGKYGIASYDALNISNLIKNNIVSQDGSLAGSGDYCLYFVSDSNAQDNTFDYNLYYHPIETNIMYTTTGYTLSTWQTLLTAT